MDEIKKESWNKKKIFAALFLLLLLAGAGYFFKTKILDSKSSLFPSSILKSVKGTVSTQERNNASSDFNVQKAIGEKIESLKQAALGLNIVEIASTSSQVQKIINDIKSLEQYPTNQAKEICRQICGL